MIVKVKVIDGHIYEIPINHDTICEQLKSKINDIVEITPAEQILIFNGTELSNPDKLIKYGIKHGSVINLTFKLKQLTVIVATQSGKSLNISASSEITVQGLKEKISTLWNIPIEEQSLILKNEILENNKKLTDYRIIDGSFIVLIPKVSKQQISVKNIFEIPNKKEKDKSSNSTIQPIPLIKHPDTSSQNNRLDGENTFDTRSNNENRGQLQPIKVNVKVWSNGLSVDDGPLRSFTEPNNIAFLHSLSTGQIPTELLQQHKYAKIHLYIEVSDKYKFVPFQGVGQMLGSSKPEIICEPAKSSQVTSLVSPINVDENKPVTQIQIRFADNSRLVVSLNHNHTVGDLKKHIISQHSQYQSVNFNLMTTFPNKILSDDSITIQEANLLNAVIVQRLV